MHRNSSKQIDQAKKLSRERKNNILHLIQNYLIDHDLTQSAEALQCEAQLGNQYTLCDNIDLDIILQEYQSYYFMKFQKYPKIVQKINENTMEKTNIKPKINNLKKRENYEIRPATVPFEKDIDNFQFDIKPLLLNEEFEEKDTQVSSLYYDMRNYSKENKEIAAQIINEFIPKDLLNVTWNDCIGLKEAAERLKEGTIYPINYPDLFENITSWRGILLYGPPGTGKTLLAKALASEKNNTFVNVSSSTFISKWRGESEKMVKILFDVAKFYSPTTIFIDEIDALVPSDNNSNHEASKRFKSELLVQLDGITQCEKKVFILATTNSPWKIDKALLRRFEKRIFIKLPNESARKELFNHFFNKNNHKFDCNKDLEKIVELTNNYSGSDIKTICKEIEMSLIREKINNARDCNETNKKERKLTIQDVLSAIAKVKPCSDQDYYQKYHEWTNKFGSF